MINRNDRSNIRLINFLGGYFWYTQHQVIKSINTTKHNKTRWIYILLEDAIIKKTKVIYPKPNTISIAQNSYWINHYDMYKNIIKSVNIVSIVMVRKNKVILTNRILGCKHIVIRRLITRNKHRNQSYYTNSWPKLNANMDKLNWSWHHAIHKNNSRHELKHIWK